MIDRPPSHEAPPAHFFTREDQPASAMPLLPETPPPEMVEGDAIVTDLPCQTCGYNLRMALVTGLCPECGAPVAGTLAAALARPGRDRWLAQVVHGVQGILLGCGVLILTPAASMLQPILGVFAGLFGAVSLFFGIQAAIEPEPGAEPSRQVRVRALATLGMYALPVCTFLLIASIPMGTPQTELLSIAIWIVGSVIPCALLLYFADIAARTPDATLANLLRYAAFAFAAFGLAQVLASVLRLASRAAAVGGAAAAGIAPAPAAPGDSGADAGETIVAAPPALAHRLGETAGTLSFFAGVAQVGLLFVTLALLAFFVRRLLQVLHRFGSFRSTRSLFEP